MMKGVVLLFFCVASIVADDIVIETKSGVYFEMVEGLVPPTFLLYVEEDEVDSSSVVTSLLSSSSATADQVRDVSTSSTTAATSSSTTAESSAVVTSSVVESSVVASSVVESSVVSSSSSEEAEYNIYLLSITNLYEIANDTVLSTIAFDSYDFNFTDVENTTQGYDFDVSVINPDFATQFVLTVHVYDNKKDGDDIVALKFDIDVQDYVWQGEDRQLALGFTFTLVDADANLAPEVEVEEGKYGITFEELLFGITSKAQTDNDTVAAALDDGPLAQQNISNPYTFIILYDSFTGSLFHDPTLTFKLDESMPAWEIGVITAACVVGAGILLTLITLLIRYYKKRQAYEEVGDKEKNKDSSRT